MLPSRNIQMGKLYPYLSYREDEKVPHEEEEEETKSIIVKVIKGNEKDLTLKEDVCIKMEIDIELRWLMVHYCDKLGTFYDSSRFMFNGARVRETDTPLQLSMVNNDVIYFFPKSIKQDFNATSTVTYGTLCIRMHKRRDTFLRLSRCEPLLDQLKRHFSNGGVGKHASTCFYYERSKLNEFKTMDQLYIRDGEIIDAFNFDENSSSLSIITPISNKLLTLKVKHTDGNVFVIKTKGNTLLSHLAYKFACWRGLSSTPVILRYNKRKLSLYKTVMEEHLLDGCRIDGHLIGEEKWLLNK